MCEPEKNKDDSHVAAHKLARLMERELRLNDGLISAPTLRLFIKQYWSRVAKHAHDIHDQE